MITKLGFPVACAMATLATGTWAAPRTSLGTVHPAPAILEASEEDTPTPGAVKPAPLRIGDPAPALGLGPFFKGEPVQRLEKGKMYLLEFWATWCTPCKMLVPHLSQVARTYRDRVTVIAVDVAEQGHEGEPYSANLGKMQRFMKGAAAGMDYAVTMDDDQRTMEKTWLEASSGGFPSAILVDREGRIAWMGYPGETLPEVLDLALEGKLDGAAIARLAARERGIQKADNAFNRDLLALLKRKRFAVALERVRTSLAEGEKAGKDMPGQRLMEYYILSRFRPQEARTCGETFLRTYANYPIYPVMLASLASGEAVLGGTPGPVDGPLALKAAQLAYERNDSQNPWVLMDLASAYGVVNDLANAVHYTELAMASVKDYGREDQRDLFEAKLKQYRAKARKTRAR